MPHKDTPPVITLDHASLSVSTRGLWQDLSIQVRSGEFIAVLGPNGSGKTSLLKVLLGLNELSKGTVEILGKTPARGNDSIGYIPQHRSFDHDLPVRGYDIVRFGLDGHRYGLGIGTSSDVRVDRVIEEVGASEFAQSPIGLLSGGQQQRLRVAQAILGDPAILLCDEPLLSLDLASQQVVSQLINDRRHKSNTTVMFVTHDINPILQMVDRVLYLVDTRWAVGTPAEILTTEKLSELYGSRVEVVKVGDRIIVVGSGEVAEHGAHHHEHGKRKKTWV